MKIQVRINEYGHEVVDCPFCPYFAFVRAITKVSSDPLRDLKRHIKNQAKNEAFWRTLSEDSTTSLHLDYYLEHTKEKYVILRKANDREFDDDFKLEK